MKKTSRNVWNAVVIGATFISIISVLVNCNHVEMESQPTSKPETMVSRSSTASPILPTSVLSSEPVLDSHQIVKNLTAYKWQLVKTQTEGFASEITTWEFYPDGTFRWAFTSDYFESHEGAWAVLVVSEKRGVIFLASAVKNQRVASRFDFLSFEFQNGRLQFGEKFYDETVFADQDMPPSIPQEVHEAVTDPQRHRFFSLWAAIADSDWQSEADPPPGDPSMYSFRADGVYTARFAVTQCQYSGTWSLFSSGGDAGEIRLSIPANLCDPRGPRDAFVRELPLVLSDTKLFLHQTIYTFVPK